jgi:archaellum component FlaC
MIKDTQALKGLKTQLSKLLGEADSLKLELGNKNREYNHKLENIKKLKDKIKSIESTKEFKVSEHAIVRYFERIKGYNIEEIEKEILTESIKQSAEILGGNGKYPNDGYHVVMKDYCIVTIEN